MDKTKGLVFKNRIVKQIPKIYMNDHVKFLDVFIDDRLSWKGQIQFVSSKLPLLISLLHEMSVLLDTNILRILHQSLYYPILNIVADTYSSSIVRDVIVLQKKF